MFWNHYLFFLLWYGCFNIVLAQPTSEIDSLQRLLDQSETDTERISHLLTLAHTLENSDTKEALLYAERGLALAKKVNDIGQSANAWQVLGNVFMAKGDLTKADSSYQRAQPLYQQLQDSLGLARLQVDQARVIVNQQKMDSALIMVQEAIPILQKYQDKRKELTALNLTAGIHYYRGNYIQALQIAQRTAQLFQDLGNRDRYAAMLLNIGNLHLVMGDYVQSLESYHQGLEEAENSNASIYVAQALDRIGALHAERERYELALSFLWRAVIWHQKNQAPIQAIEAWQSIGSVESKQGKYDSAHIHLKRSLELAQENNNPLLAAKSRASLGINYQQQGKHQKAIKELVPAIAYLEKANAPTQAVTAYQALAEVYLSLDDFQRAQTYAVKSLEQSQQASYPDAEMDASRTLAKIAVALGDTDDAYHYQVRASELADSLYRGERNILIEEMNAQFDAEQREERITFLEQEGALQKLRLQRQRTTIIGGSIGLLLLGMLALIAYQSYQAKARTNHKLEERQREKDQLLQERETLLREIHHRVKNNLQIVLTMLRLQGRRTDSDETLSVLQGMESRVQSMALIHEDLYVRSELHQLAMDTYLEKLLQNIFKIYDREDRITYRVKSDEIQITLEVAIPVALIINELATNSLKHAFPDGRTGCIYISFISQEKGYAVTVEDDGIGFQFNQDHSDESFGLEIVQTLTKQLDGRLNYQSNGTTCFHLEFNHPLYESTNRRGRIVSS